MDPFSLSRHLYLDHKDVVDAWALSSDDANKVHHRLHGRLSGKSSADHGHEWIGNIADPQGPITDRRA